MKKFIFLLISVFVVASLIACAFAAKPAKNVRGKRPKANCSLALLEQCLNKFDSYRNKSDSYNLIKTSRGLDEICRYDLRDFLSYTFSCKFGLSKIVLFSWFLSNSQDTLTCYSNFVSKCGTPIQQEMFGFGIEHYTKAIDRFCKPGELRTGNLRAFLCSNSKPTTQDRNDISFPVIDNLFIIQISSFIRLA